MTDDLQDYSLKALINIIAQTLSEISVNITKQDLASLAVDLAAASIGNLNIDVAAQTISSIDIDVVAQTLDRLFNRPTYGGAAKADFSVSVPDSSETTLFSVSGTGMTYGGFARHAFTPSYNAVEYRLYVDGTQLTDRSIDTMNTYNLYTPFIHPLHINFYSEDSGIVVVGLMPNLTFESSLALKVYQWSGSAHTFTGDMYYATV